MDSNTEDRSESDTEENGKRRKNSKLLDQNNARQEKDAACFYCNGFYGPVDSEFVCSTCHFFVLDEHANNVALTSLTPPCNDSDSGNDEPPEGCAGTFRELDQRNELNLRNNNIIHLDRRIQELTISSNDDQNIVGKLPPEILIKIFSYLDEVGLWVSSQVCSLWSTVIMKFTNNESWATLMTKIWPLYRPIAPTTTTTYHSISAMMTSSTCIPCLLHMLIQIEREDSRLNHMMQRRLAIEQRVMFQKPAKGIRIVSMDRDSYHWQACFEGPIDSPYEGGIFYLHMQMSDDYPLMPPKVRFLTKIYHPNISRHGDIGLDSLSHNWIGAYTMEKIVISIQSLLTDPCCKVCMEREIADEYLNDRKKYNEKALEWTWKYAMWDVFNANIYESYFTSN